MDVEESVPDAENHVIPRHRAQRFICEIWDDCKDYHKFLLSHLLSLISTLVVLKIVILVANSLFTEDYVISGNLTSDTIITSTEVVSHIGILLLFFIYIGKGIRKFLR